MTEAYVIFAAEGAVDVVVTAGATRNPIDAMRYISAGSSGGTGVALARAWRDGGLDVHLLGSAEARLRAPELPGEEYWGTRDLMARMERVLRANPRAALVHAAAVGDYELASPEAGKTPSGQASWTLTLTPTPKIADRVRDWGHTGPYVTFKAAAPGTSEADLTEIARKQRQRTGCDLVFANVLGRLSQGILLVGEQVERYERRDEAMGALIEWVASALDRA